MFHMDYCAYYTWLVKFLFAGTWHIYCRVLEDMELLKQIMATAYQCSILAPVPYHYKGSLCIYKPSDIQELQHILQVAYHLGISTSDIVLYISALEASGRVVG
jgi:hypothetical protein